jgi:hypothetical protein
VRDRSHITTSAWNCCFPASGVQTINIVLNAISGGREHPILVDKHEVTVDNLFTVTWLPILVAVIPILTAVIASVRQTKKGSPSGQANRLFALSSIQSMLSVLIPAANVHARMHAKTVFFSLQIACRSRRRAREVLQYTSFRDRFSSRPSL